MLVLGVAAGQYVMIGDDIKICIYKTSEESSSFQVGIKAPKKIPIYRQKLYERITGQTDAEPQYGVPYEERKAAKV